MGGDGVRPPRGLETLSSLQTGYLSAVRGRLRILGELVDGAVPCSRGAA